MSFDDISARIDDFAARISAALATDAEFERDLVGILGLIRPEGYDVRIAIAERDTDAPVAVYRSSSSQDRTDEPNNTKNLASSDQAVKCTIKVWNDRRTAIRPGNMDLLLRGLERVIDLHWGERNVLTLLPWVQIPSTEPRLLRFVETATTQATQMAVLHTDLDNFKEVNCQFGEPGGDAVLKEFGARFRRAFSDIGVVVRTGGEEFSAILFHDDAGHILERAEAFRATMELEPFERIKRPNTCSIGLAIYPDASAAVAKRSSNKDELLHDAREAERRAKNEGRNCIRFGVLSERKAVGIQVAAADLFA